MKNNSRRPEKIRALNSVPDAFELQSRIRKSGPGGAATETSGGETRKPDL